MKKANVLAAVILLMILITGCGSKTASGVANNETSNGAANEASGGQAAGSDKETIIYPETTDARPLTIGYTFWDVDINDFAIAQADQIKLVAEALGVNLLFNPDNTDFSTDSVVRAAETFADQDVDGMIVVNFSEDPMVDISNICQEAEIPFIQATRTIDDEDIAQLVEANPFYVGRIHENEYAAAYEVGRNVIEQGACNIIMICPEEGDASYEARAEGFRDACEEPDVKIVEELWNMTDDDDEATTEAIKEVFVRHPEADAVFSIRGGFFSCIMDAEKQLRYKDYLPMGGIDFDSTLEECYDAGAQVTVAGGHHADASLSLITLVNAIRGAYDSSLYPIDINNSMLIIDSLSEYNDYKEWCLGEEDSGNRQILNANDARSLCVDFNPETKLTDIISFAENVSVEGTKNRHRNQYYNGMGGS